MRVLPDAVASTLPGWEPRGRRRGPVTGGAVTGGAVTGGAVTGTLSTTALSAFAGLLNALGDAV